MENPTIERTYFVPKEVYTRRPSEEMAEQIHRATGEMTHADSMLGQMLGYGMNREPTNEDVHSIYYKLYSEGSEEVPPDFHLQSEYETHCLTRLQKAEPSGRHFAKFCVTNGEWACEEEIGVSLNLTQECYSSEFYQYGVLIFYQFDSQIREVTQIIVSEHPELSFTNVSLFLYSALIFEFFHLQPHDVWQDVSACGWVGAFNECSFADKIEKVIDQQYYETYDNPVLAVIRQASFDRAWEDCSLIDECASKLDIRKGIYENRPTWWSRMIWRYASRQEETHRLKQGFGLGQIVLGYFMKAAQDEKTRTPFIEQGLLTGEECDSEEKALETILNRNSFIYAKGLTFLFALNDLKKSLMAAPEVAFASDDGYFIPNDATARELGLLTMAEEIVRFPDEKPEGLDDKTIVIQAMKKNVQDFVMRLFITGHYLGLSPETPGLAMDFSGRQQLIQKGAVVDLDSDALEHGLPGFLSWAQINPTFVHWVPPFEQIGVQLECVEE